jgi:hypothetical protein
MDCPRPRWLSRKMATVRSAAGRLIAVIANAPAALRPGGRGSLRRPARYPVSQLDRPRIIHHLADSHVNSYIRFKWTDGGQPTIKAYDEGDGRRLEDSRTGDVRAAPSLAGGLHARWCELLQDARGAVRPAFQPPRDGQVSQSERRAGLLRLALPAHTAQILWVRRQHGW